MTATRPEPGDGKEAIRKRDQLQRVLDGPAWAKALADWYDLPAVRRAMDRAKEGA